MIHTVVFENTIKLWWDYNAETARGGYYIITASNGEQIKTDKTHCTFSLLAPDTIYTFNVSLFNAQNKKIKDLGEIERTTLLTKKKIDITKAPYFAVGDGKTNNTQALQQAINDCKPEEYVYIPNGVFLTGSLKLHSNMELRLEQNATLQGSTEPNDYLPKCWSRFEGIEMECYASLLHIGELNHKEGCTTENVVICGGKICGGGEQLRRRMITEAEKAFNTNVLPSRRRGRLISVHNAKNVVVSDVEAGDSPAWNVHMVYSDNVVFCGGKIFSHGISNGDGWDPDSSTNCTLFDVDFDTGDDCVAVKSGKNPEGNVINRPCEHICVFDCRSKGGNGIAIGSEMSGGIDDVKIWDCDIQTSFAGFNIKTTPSRGGYIKNIGIYRSKTSKILFRTFMSLNDDGESAHTVPRLENFAFEDITITGVETYTDNQRIDKANAVDAIGYPTKKLKGLKLKNICLKYRPMMPWHIFDLVNVEDVEIENITCKSYM